MIFHDINEFKQPQGVIFLAKIQDATNGSIDYEVAELWPGGELCPGGEIHTSQCCCRGLDDITDEVISWAYIEES